MTSDELSTWKRLNPKRDRVPLYQLASEPCVDCDDPEFVQRMLTEGCCNGIPGPVMP